MTINDTLVGELAWEREINSTSLLYEQIVNLINTIYYLLLVPVAAVGNLLTIIVVVYIVRHRKRKHNVPDLCLGVLAVVDLCSVLFVHPVTVGALYATEWVYPNWVCLYQGFAASVYLKMEFIVQVLLTLDRHLALVTPLRYRSFNSSSTLRTTVVTALTFSVGTTALSFWLSSEPVIFVRTWQFCSPAAGFSSAADIVLNTIVSAVFLVGIVLFVTCNVTLVSILRHYHKQRADALLKQISEAMRGAHQNGAVRTRHQPRANRPQQTQPPNGTQPNDRRSIIDIDPCNRHAKTAAPPRLDRCGSEKAPAIGKDALTKPARCPAIDQSTADNCLRYSPSQETNQAEVSDRSTLRNTALPAEVGLSTSSVTTPKQDGQLLSGKAPFHDVNDTWAGERLSADQSERAEFNMEKRLRLIDRTVGNYGCPDVSRTLRKCKSFADITCHGKLLKEDCKLSASNLNSVNLRKPRYKSQTIVWDRALGLQIRKCSSDADTSRGQDAVNDLPECQTLLSKHYLRHDLDCSQERLATSKPIPEALTLYNPVVQPCQHQLQAATACTTMTSAKPCTKLAISKPLPKVQARKSDLLQVPLPRTSLLPNSPPMSPAVLSLPNSSKMSMSRSNNSWDPARALYVQQQMAKFLKKMEKKAQKQKKELLLAKMVLFCASLFIMTWLPYISVTILSFCYVTVPVIVSDVALKLVFLNAFLNPVFYGLCRKTYRQGFSYLIQIALYFICCGSVQKPGEDKVFFDSHRKKVKRHLEAAMFVAQSPTHQVANQQPALNKSAHALQLLQRTLSMRPGSPGVCQEFKPSKRLEELYERYMMESDSSSSGDTSPIDYEALVFSDDELYQTLQRVWSAYLTSDDCNDDDRGFEKADSDIDLDIDYDMLLADDDVFLMADVKPTDNVNDNDDTTAV